VKDAISDLETSGQIIIECDDSPGFKQVVYTGPETAYQQLMRGDMNGTAPNSMRLVRHSERTTQRLETILRECRKGVALNPRERIRLGIKKRPLVPLDPDKPSHTLTTQPDDLVHYSEPRTLTVREYARLQSFPDWYEFSGNYATGGLRRRVECPRYTQVGNAVPPFVAEILGQAIAGL
jgi:DNA (cytosine-5)-methyltransferase 1